MKREPLEARPDALGYRLEKFVRRNRREVIAAFAAAIILVGLVVIFQAPLVVFGLVQLGVLTSRTLRKHRRLGYFITAGVALALPGPDLLTTFLELLPMWLLFEASIWLAVLVERRRAKVAPASATLGG